MEVMTRHDRMPASGNWECVARRGEFAVGVLSVALARALGIPCDPDTALVAVVMPDRGEAVPVSHVSIESVCAFIRELRPHTVGLKCMPGENVDQLREALVAARREGNDADPAQESMRAGEIADAALARAARKDGAE
jgi:hypothetical protein